VQYNQICDFDSFVSNFLSTSVKPMTLVLCHWSNCTANNNQTKRSSV